MDVFRFSHINFSAILISPEVVIGVLVMVKAEPVSVIPTEVTVPSVNVPRLKSPKIT